MKKISILLCVMIFVSCHKRKKILDDQLMNYYVLRTSAISNSVEKEESIAYFLVNNELFENESFISKDYSNINEVRTDLIKKYYGLPILDFPIKFWQASCQKGRLDLDKSLTLRPKDSIVYAELFKELTDSELYFYKILKMKKPIAYNVSIGFARLTSVNYCTILWNEYYSDSTAVLLKGTKISSFN